jgi:hypothetical protein
VLNIEVGYNKYYTSYICRSGVFFISFSENICREKWANLRKLPTGIEENKIAKVRGWYISGTKMGILYSVVVPGFIYIETFI